MTVLSSLETEALRSLDTCTVANAIENFEIRLRNEGFIIDSARCVFPKLPPMLGYAVPVRVRCSSPPTGSHLYKDRTDWWNYILQIPAPRVVVVEDVDPNPGTGAFVGEVHAEVLRALGCVGVVTNGTVRDIPQIEKMGFQLFAGGTAVSHAFVHIVEFGTPVEIGGLKIAPGELLHGDLHGIVSIPRNIAADIPRAAAENQARDKKIIDICRSADFSVEKLRAAVKGIF